MTLTKRNYKKDPKIAGDITPLYLSSFPEDERPLLEYFYGLVDLNDENEIFAYYDKSEFVGFTYLTFYKDIVYIFFLAVHPRKRNMGYGSQILEDVKKSNNGKVILLCSEVVDDKYLDNEIRKRRQDFYFRNGFTLNGLKTKENGVIFETMVYGPHRVSFEDYREIFLLGFGKEADKYLKKND